jgi:hypothetical protein
VCSGAERVVEKSVGIEALGFGVELRIHVDGPEDDTVSFDHL